MGNEKPTVLLVQGAWHTTAAYQDFLDVLEAKGYPTSAPELPSGREVTPSDPPEADIRHYAAVAKSLVDSGKEVIVVAHSYGGVITSEAFSGLGVKSRHAQGLTGGVRLIIFVAAFLLEPGKSLEMSAPIEIVPWCEYQGEFKMPKAGEDVGPVFYPDLPREQQQKWSSSLTKHPKACSFFSPTRSCYDEADIAFIYCDQDVAFPFVAQQAVVGGVKASGVMVHEATLASGHFPSLSMPGELANTVVKFIEA